MIYDVVFWAVSGGVLGAILGGAFMEGYLEAKGRRPPVD